MTRLLAILIAFAAVRAEADHATVRFGPSALQAGTVNLSLDGDRRWPAPTTVELRNVGGGSTFSAALSGNDAAELRRIIAPPGRYRLAIRAAHHASAERDVVIGPAAELSLGEILLRPLPVARGTVTYHGAPLANATVTTMNGAESSTGRDGSFEVELSKRHKHFGSRSDPSERKSSRSSEARPMSISRPSPCFVPPRWKCDRL